MENVSARVMVISQLDQRAGVKVIRIWPQVPQVFSWDERAKLLLLGVLYVFDSQIERGKMTVGPIWSRSK